VHIIINAILLQDVRGTAWCETNSLHYET